MPQLICQLKLQTLNISVPGGLLLREGVYIVETVASTGLRRFVQFLSEAVIIYETSYLRNPAPETKLGFEHGTVC